ncbi:uncharacterized protein E5676_scaffold629G00410 [Cucumis melo var. makuwa]|uniref:Uncharacterized protein n=1 Tax=Cucumis melo var. makuwa TaxID=1194695 RepID=A0A5D3DXI3_CUCMM|nr:uncharacterized protein E5676_scaffold629G00410 [Cucumis melo var. makuwa]
MLCLSLQNFPSPLLFLSSSLMEPCVDTRKRLRDDSNDDSLFNSIGSSSKFLRLENPADSNFDAPVSQSTDSFQSHHTIQEDLLKILDDTDASIDREAAIQDLDSVIRSFEKEIEVPVPVVQPELGFLLEASDDELGLPPAGEKEEIEEAEFSGSGGVKGVLGFEDEIVSNYCWFDNLRCEIKEWSPEEEEEVVALGGLFDHTDVAAELPTAYRSERMPCL